MPKNDEVIALINELTPLLDDPEADVCQLHRIKAQIDAAKELLASAESKFQKIKKACS